MTLGKELDAQITALYLAGLSMSQIGRRVGLDRHRVRHSLRRTNTPTRSIGEAKRLAAAMGSVSLRKSA